MYISAFRFRKVVYEITGIITRSSGRQNGHGEIRKLRSWREIHPDNIPDTGAEGKSRITKHTRCLDREKEEYDSSAAGKFLYEADFDPSHWFGDGIVMSSIVRERFSDFLDWIFGGADLGISAMTACSKRKGRHRFSRSMKWGA